MAKAVGIDLGTTNSVVAATMEGGHAEVSQVLVVGLAGEHDPGATFLLGKRLDAGAQTLLEHVVAKHDHRPVAAHEPLRQAQRFGDASGLLLVRVEEALDSVVVPVTELALAVAVPMSR